MAVTTEIYTTIASYGHDRMVRLTWSERRINNFGAANTSAQHSHFDPSLTHRANTAATAPRRPVECVLLALTSPSGNKGALPPVERAVPQAELLRKTLIGRAARGQRIHCPSLVGLDSQGRPLKNQHGHAHFLPLDLDGDQRLDHILIFAPDKLCPTAQQAIRSLRRTWSKGGVGDLQLAVVGIGDRDHFRRMRSAVGQNLQNLVTTGRSRHWQSVTPFVPPRFLKQRGKNSLLGQINAELESRGLPPAESVEVLEEETKAMRHFVRVRRRGGQPPPMDIGYALHITLSQAAPGPLALGYASHYGLGLFRAKGGVIQS